MCGFTYVYRDFSHARRLTLRVNLGGEFTKTTGLGAALWRGPVLCRQISREIALLPPQSQRYRQSRRYRAEAALNGPVTGRRASFTPQFRAVRVRHASIRPNLSPRPRGVGGPNDERFRRPKTRFE
jgi:hypothetical protein